MNQCLLALLSASLAAPPFRAKRCAGSCAPAGTAGTEAVRRLCIFQQHALGPSGFGLASSLPCSTTMPVRGRYEAPPSEAPGGCGRPFCCSTSSARSGSASDAHTHTRAHAAHALRAMARNACSTPLFSFALVPNSAAPMDAAYASDSSSDTCLLRSMSTLLPARTSAMSLPAEGARSSPRARRAARAAHQPSGAAP